MFKVGDKGKTRGGVDYEVVDVELHPNDEYPIKSLQNGYVTRYHTTTGHWLDNTKSHNNDLMPPESSHDSECAEFPECSCEDEGFGPEYDDQDYDFAEVADLAAQIARDNPGMYIHIEPGSAVITLVQPG